MTLSSLHESKFYLFLHISPFLNCRVCFASFLLFIHSNWRMRYASHERSQKSLEWIFCLWCHPE